MHPGTNLCCHLGSYFKRPKSSPARPSACNWYYCAQSIARPKAACALRLSWAATLSNLGWMTEYDVTRKTGSTERVTTPAEEDRVTAIGNTHKKIYRAEPTRSSAIAEGPRDASCQLKSCQLPRNSAETTLRQVLNQVSAVANWPMGQNRAVDSAWRSVR